MSDTSGRRGPSELVTVEDLQSELNAVEELLSGLSATDEYLRAMLRNQRVWLMSEMARLQGQPRQNPVPGLDVSTDPLPDALIIRPEDIVIGATGVCNRSIQKADYGPSTFQVNGTIFNENVRANEDLSAGDIVHVIAPGNIVQEVENVSVSFFGLSAQSNRSTEPSSALLIGNQSYDDGSISDIGSGLNAGQIKTFARIRPGPNERVFVTGINQSQHSTVEYRISADGVIQDQLTGTSPLAVPPDFFTPPAGYMEIDDEIEAIIEETSGNNSYTDVEATLKGFTVGG